MCIRDSIATGAHSRPIGCKGEAEFTGKGVSYCATCDANFFEDFEVYVAVSYTHLDVYKRQECLLSRHWQQRLRHRLELVISQVLQQRLQLADREDVYKKQV